MFESTKIPENLIPSDPRFGAGPSLVPVEFLERLKDTGKSLLGTSHRKPAVKNVVKELQEGLQKFFQLDDKHHVVLGNGGATLLFDMIGLGLVKQKSSHYVTGEFSSKWYKSHAAIPWIETEINEVDFGKGSTPQIPSDCDMVCMTLNETSTGVIVDQFPESGGDCLVAVDATSGGAQVPCDVNKTDLFFFSPQKVFASEGGLWVAIMSDRAIQRATEIGEDKSRYVPGIMKWKLAIDNGAKNQTYNTPAISTLFLLNEQVKLMNKVGYQGVLKDGEEKLKHITEWVESKDYLSFFVQDTQYRSPVVATIDFDEKIPVGDLTKRLREDNVAIDIDAYRKLGRNQLRIGMFYNVQLEDLKKLTGLISHLVEAEL